MFNLTRFASHNFAASNLSPSLTTSYRTSVLMGSLFALASLRCLATWPLIAPVACSTIRWTSCPWSSLFKRLKIMSAKHCRAPTDSCKLSCCGIPSPACMVSSHDAQRRGTPRRALKAAARTNGGCCSYGLFAWSKNVG